MPEPIIPNFKLPDGAWGVTEEPRTTRYFETYFDALGPVFKEGIGILDYGCGCGRLANYVSAKLDEFSYWGVEQDNDFGRWSIEYGARLFEHDPRVWLGAAGSWLEDEAIQHADAAVLSSVFTHLPFGAGFEPIMLKLRPIWERGAVVFSCFLADRPQLHQHGLFGEGTFGAAFYTVGQLDWFATRYGVRLTECARVFVDFDHVIYRAERA
jgi:hypothetical protein